MGVESDAKFEEKLALGFKNDMMNLVNFNASSVKSENLHFDVLLLSIAYIQFQLKKRRRVISHDTEEWSKLWRKTHFLFEKWHKKFDEFYNVWAKIIQMSCVVKNDYGFKNDIWSLVNFHTSSWK